MATRDDSRAGTPAHASGHTKTGSEHDPDAYPVEFTPISEERGGGYLLSYPDLPGCFAYGYTKVEALTKGMEAARIWMKHTAERGISIPKPGEHELPKGNLRVRVPRLLHKRVAKQAEQTGTSVNTFVATTLKEELDLLPKAWNPDDYGKYSGEWMQRLAPQLHHSLRYRAEEQDVSINTLINSLLERGICRREEDKFVQLLKDMPYGHSWAAEPAHPSHQDAAVSHPPDHDQGLVHNHNWASTKHGLGAMRNAA